MENKNIYKFGGACTIISKLPLFEVAKKISNALFGGIPFIYGKHVEEGYYIWGDIPSMYIERNILGIDIAIGEVDGMKKDKLGNAKYILLLQSSLYIYIKNNDLKTVNIDLDFYLYHILKDGLKDDTEIEVIEPENI